MKRIATAAVCAAAALLTVSVSGCSGSTAHSAAGSSTSDASTSGGGYGGTTTPSATSAAATVGTKAVGKLGTILVDGKGRTLYLFLADKSTTSTCQGACATAWPPLLTPGSPKTGKGAKANLLNTSKRSGGKKQVTYHGHPLYYYAGDSKPGQTTGQGLNQFGALWYVVDPAGNKVTK